jgi:small conductance mechanosensitive channel
MESQFTKLQNLGILVTKHGPELVIGLLILILGITFTKWFMKILKSQLKNITKNQTTISIISNTIGILLIVIVISAAAIEIGAKPDRVVSFLVILSLISIGIVVIFRPLLPTLPFSVGNIVKIGDLLGKVEATTILNTRVRTFDGKTFFVPNRKILDDIVINYHFTKTRRIKVNIIIRYDQDLLRAKQALEAVMFEDPRILEKPSPQIYILDLGSNGIEIGPRCWVDNIKYWQTKCDFTEKIKYRFDTEGIQFAYPQLDIHHYNGTMPMDRKTEDEIIDDLESKDI